MKMGKSLNSSIIGGERVFLLIAMLVLTVFVSQTAFAATMQGDYLYAADVTDVRFLPASITAGDTVSMALDVQNKGTTVAISDVVASLELGSYFEPITTTDTISSIGPGATKTSVLKFRVKDDVQAGYYQVFLTLNYKRVDYPGTSIVDVNQTKTITVAVSSGQNNLGVEINPKVISPGSQIPLTFTISNPSSNTISNVLLTWEESNQVLLPLGSDNRKFADKISSGQSVDFNYMIVADPSSTTGVYPIDITLTYNDSTGAQKQTSQVGIIVGGGTTFQISSDTLTSGQVSFSIANVGSNNASAVVVQLKRQPGLTITGSDTVIIGNINKGDYSTANFTVQATTDQNASSQRGGFNRTGSSSQQPTGAQTLPDFNAEAMAQRIAQSGYVVDVYYTDTTGQRLTLEQPFQLGSARTTTSATGFSVNGRTQQDNSGTITIIVMAVIVVIGALFNKFKAKIKWKKFAKVVALGVIIPGAIILFVPSSYISMTLAGVFLIGTLAWLFLKEGKK